MEIFLLVFAAGIWAGGQNALAGGGSFITLPALVLAGLDPRAANITSTLALFPGQIATGLAGRANVSGTPVISFRWLFIAGLLGGATGALLLLATPPRTFARMVPWLVLIATLLFAWGSFTGKNALPRRQLNGWQSGLVQYLISIYGGYFGGGMGIMIMSVLTLGGMALRNAGATKNALAIGINATAFLVLAFSPDAHWKLALLLGAGAAIGGLGGAWALARVNETALRIAIIGIGTALSIGLFLRPI